ncbi:unnamed protein product [Gongylonema pulchrum]|uniref:Peptidase S1 domain-containing protein n=1 Tax=Gongylonema pulchrum TaxID=637853 RepID=A0A183DW49_9BILA|nr:unnamed protein product [Gongylonema pulchrum]
MHDLPCLCGTEDEIQNDDDVSEILQTFEVLDPSKPIPVSCKQLGIGVTHQGQILYIDVEYPEECWGKGEFDARDAIQSVFDCSYMKTDRVV